MQMLHTFRKMKEKMLLQLKLRRIPVVVRNSPTVKRIQLLSIVEQVADWIDHHCRTVHALTTTDNAVIE